MLTKTQKAAVLELNAKRDYPIAEKYILELAESVRRAVSEKNYRIYARVEHASRSGMSRTISLAIMHKGELVPINHIFGVVYGDRKSPEKDGSVYIAGCGMDMLFEATYRLYSFFYPYRPGKGQARPYQERLNRYTSY